MAIQNSFVVDINVVGDGTSTSFSFDLSKDAYSVQTPGSGLVLENWFTQDRRFTAPLNVLVNSGNLSSASLSGTVVSLIFSTPPPSLPQTLASVILVF